MEPYTFETFVQMENERARQEAEPLVEETKELLDIIIEAKDIWEGEHYPLEQVLVQVGWDWERLHPVIKEVFLKEIGDYLGIDLINPPKDKLIGEYEMKGVMGAPTEGMTAEVQVFPTKFSEIELHLVRYPEPVGVRYDLV